ncbi:MAG: hypothetical protein MUF87_11240 [Anaerolineae bacterium]|jgi:hypothetical protein|nr:hypothetical protein [Anaerolineae bacterium]
MKNLIARLQALPTFAKVLIGATAAIILFVIALFVIFFWRASVDPVGTAVHFQILRDIFLIIIALQGILIVAALCILILQIAGLVNLLRNEIKPLIVNLQETLTTVKGTTQFVGENLATPLIKASSFAAGVSVLLRELGGLRRAIRRTDGESVDEDEKQSA